MAGTLTLTLASLRQRLEDTGIDSFVIPTDDPHMSEYVHPYFGRREFVSGFSGSAGTAVVTKDAALLWTDGRYFIQAEQELSSQWTLMRAGTAGTPTVGEYLSSNLTKDACVGIDPTVHSASFVQELQNNLKSKGVTIKSLMSNPVDALWEARPPPPCGEVRVHPIEYAGESISEKLAKLRKEMIAKGADVIILSQLDEIMYTCNIRGGDVPCNPVSLSYMCITLTSAVLFIDPRKISPQVEAHLNEGFVSVEPYESVFEFTASLFKDGAGSPSLNISASPQVWMDPKTINYALWMTVPQPNRLGDGITSPVVLMKATKNEAEMTGMVLAHNIDGAALARFFSWLEKVYSGGGQLTECEIDEELIRFRKAHSEDVFIEPSFPTIAGVNDNGAIVHYRAKPEKQATLTANDMILIDSGGQYFCGTTDVTRTIHMGQPTPEQMHMFTRVLKGNIAVDSCVFPEGTPGCALDILARRSLWQAGVDFAHGVGHGVGAALNVHEGPHSISPRYTNLQPLMPGMVVSNEPGFYSKGKFGIRIENLLHVQRANLHAYNGKGFLVFARLTKVPIQKSLIAVELLSPDEVQWVNNYHAEVYSSISPLLCEEGDESALAWLKKATSPLDPTHNSNPNLNPILVAQGSG